MNQAAGVGLAGVLLFTSLGETRELLAETTVAPSAAPTQSCLHEQIFMAPAEAALDVGRAAAHSTSRGQFEEPGWWLAYLRSS